MKRKLIMLATLAIAFSMYFVAGWIITDPGFSPTASTVNTNLVDVSTEHTDIQEALLRPYSPIIGKRDAPVTIVEFFDPACEACRAFYPVLKQILAEFPNEVRIVVRYTPFHGAGSELAILMLEAARLQDLFIPVKEALLDNQDVWAAHGSTNTESIAVIAAEAGLNLEEAAIQIKSPSIVGILNQDRADVKTMGIKQTPTFFINGKPLAEFGSTQLLAEVRKAVKKLRTDSN